MFAIVAAMALCQTYTNQHHTHVFPDGNWSETFVYSTPQRPKIPVNVYVKVEGQKPSKRPWMTYTVNSPTTWRGAKLNIQRWCEKNKYQCVEVDPSETQIKVYLEPIPKEEEKPVQYPKGTGPAKK